MQNPQQQLTGVFCMIFGGHSAVAAGAVGSGLSSPEKWTLLFGSPLEAWSIGRFWRRFWHQDVQRVSTSADRSC